MKANLYFVTQHVWWPAEFYYVVDIEGSVNIAMEIVLTELPRWYSIVCVKYGHYGDDWNLSLKCKLKTLCSFIPVKRHLTNMSRDEA